MDIIYIIFKKLGIFTARKMVVKYWNNLVERNKRDPDTVFCVLRKRKTSKFGECLNWIINGKEFILTQYSYETSISPHLQKIEITKILPIPNSIINSISSNEVIQTDFNLSTVIGKKQTVIANNFLISIFHNSFLFQKNNINTNHNLYREIRDDLQICDIIITIEVSENIEISDSICNLKATDFGLPERNLTFEIITK